MAKVTGPLLSTFASGNLKKTIVYSFKRGVNVVKYFKASPDVRSHAQILQRGLYSEAKDKWNELSDAEKLSWKQYATGRCLTGYNAFLKDYILSNDIRESYAFAYICNVFLEVHNFINYIVFRKDYLIGIAIDE